jgi:hypothetical protein
MAARRTGYLAVAAVAFAVFVALLGMVFFGFV